MKQVERSRLITIEAINYAVVLVQDLETRQLHIASGTMSESVRKYLTRKINKFNEMLLNTNWYKP